MPKRRAIHSVSRKGDWPSTRSPSQCSMRASLPRPSAGDAANVAKMLVKNGVQKVLAMSFGVSHSAAELFLRAFYHALFLDGRSFSDTARRGRDVLRR